MKKNNQKIQLKTDCLITEPLDFFELVATFSLAVWGQLKAPKRSEVWN